MATRPRYLPDLSPEQRPDENTCGAILHRLRIDRHSLRDSIRSVVQLRICTAPHLHAEIRRKYLSEAALREPRVG